MTDHDEQIRQQTALNQQRAALRQRALRPWQDRLKSLKREAKTAHGALSAITAERMELLRERMRLDGLRKENREQPAVIEARSAILIEIDELDRALETATATWQPQADLLVRCEEWLERNSSRIVDAYHASSAAPGADDQEADHDH